MASPVPVVLLLPPALPPSSANLNTVFFLSLSFALQVRNSKRKRTINALLDPSRSSSFTWDEIDPAILKSRMGGSTAGQRRKKSNLAKTGEAPSAPVVVVAAAAASKVGAGKRKGKAGLKCPPFATVEARLFAKDCTGVWLTATVKEIDEAKGRLKVRMMNDQS